MSGPLRSEDDDPRAQRMIEDPDRYFGEAWERTRREVLAERGGGKPAVLAPGIVAMSLRGASEDVERVLVVLRAAGVIVRRHDSRGTRSGNAAGFRYYTVEVPSAE